MSASILDDLLTWVKVLIERLTKNFVIISKIFAAPPVNMILSTQEKKPALKHRRARGWQRWERGQPCWTRRSPDKISFFKGICCFGGFDALHQSERQTMVAASPPMAKKAMLQRETKVPPIAWPVQRGTKVLLVLSLWGAHHLRERSYTPAGSDPKELQRLPDIIVWDKFQISCEHCGIVLQNMF